jgi:Xaa-Pro aminopeptidase
MNRIVSFMAECGLSQMVVSSTPSVYYLTGLWIDPPRAAACLYALRTAG